MLCAQYCMPTDAPHLSRRASSIAQLMSPVLWMNHMPDRFDSYSAGARSYRQIRIDSPHLMCYVALAYPTQPLPQGLTASSHLKGHESLLKPHPHSGQMGAWCPQFEASH